MKMNKKIIDAIAMSFPKEKFYEYLKDEIFKKEYEKWKTKKMETSSKKNFV